MSDTAPFTVAMMARAPGAGNLAAGFARQVRELVFEVPGAPVRAVRINGQAALPDAWCDAGQGRD